MFTIDISTVIGVAIQIVIAVIILFVIPWVAKKNPTIATFLKGKRRVPQKPRKFTLNGTNQCRSPRAQ